MPTRFSLTAEQKGKLYEKLVKFRLSQSGHGRTLVGTISLSSGITIEMINEFYEKAHTFSSVEDIEERLPVFIHNHGVFRKRNLHVILCQNDLFKMSSPKRCV